MIRFIVRQKKKHACNGAETVTMYTIDDSLTDLEAALTAGGFSEDAYEFHELVGAEVIKQ